MLIVLDEARNKIVFGLKGPVAKAPAYKAQAQAYITEYSFALFNGIHSLDNPNEFRFYLAKDNKPIPNQTVVFEVLCGDGKTLHWYDLSNEKP